MEDVLIVGKLDSKELEKSINDLIDYVDKGTSKMVQSFDTALGKIQSKLQDLSTHEAYSLSRNSS